jgi:hypothetical protein
MSNILRLAIKGSRTTRCFEDNIELCDEADSKYIKTQWEETRKDILNFCNTTSKKHTCRFSYFKKSAFLINVNIL